MIRFPALVRRFRRDESGVFAVMFGLMAVVLVALGGAVVDYVALQQARSRSQIALDAAVLALQPLIYQEPLNKADIKTKAQNLLQDRLGGTFDAIATVGDVQVDLDKGSLTIDADMSMPTMFVSLVGVNNLSAHIVAEATHGAVNIEVAVALDLSNSMNNSISDGNGGWTTKIASLRTALGQLIDLIVQDDQDPTYSKMALVPYSMAVNVGSYADTVRGGIVAPAAISDISWSVGSAKSVTGAARSSWGQPVTITTSQRHNLNSGDFVYINNVDGTWQVNNKIYQVTVTTNRKFTLDGTTSGSFDSYSSGGKVTKCVISTCELVVTANDHGLVAGDQAYISGAGGMDSYSYTSSYDTYDNNPSDDDSDYDWVNNNPSDKDYRFLVWTIGAATTNTFVLPGTARTNGKSYGTYTSGGTVACVVEGCSQLLFTNPYSGWYGANASKRRNAISTCVTERDVNTFTDASYLTTLVGRNYHASGNLCLANTIVPLTSAKTSLHALASTLTASGSTGGQIGVAWAWYMLSPTFNGPWPTASKPATTSSEEPVAKAVVLMSDGEYNSIYKSGVIAQNSTSGAGDTYSMFGEDAQNGSSYEQTTQLCQAMKNANITVYTVGLDIDDKPVAIAMMANCASDPSKAYIAGSGQDLEDVFAEIAANLSELRLSQ